MRTAILISGQTRSFSRVVLNQKRLVYDRLPEPTFFCSVAQDGDADQLQALRKWYPEERVKIEEQEQPEVAPPPNLQELLDASPEPIAKDSTVAGCLKQFWHLTRVAEFAGGPTALAEFDLVVRLRPDLRFHAFPDQIDLPPGNAVTTVWWERAGGVNDRFAVMRPEAVKAYFYALIWARMSGWAQGAPVHPETLLDASLKANGARVVPTLGATFSICRKDGALVLPNPSLADLADFIAARSNRQVIDRSARNE